MNDQVAPCVLEMEHLGCDSSLASHNTTRVLLLPSPVMMMVEDVLVNRMSVGKCFEPPDVLAVMKVIGIITYYPRMIHHPGWHSISRRPVHDHITLGLVLETSGESSRRLGKSATYHGQVAALVNLNKQ